MSRLIELWTGDDGESHYAERDFDIPIQDALRVHATVTPAGGTYEWHTAPHRQYVITLTGTCASLDVSGAANTVTVTLAPGAPLTVAGSGQKVHWRSSGEPRQDFSGVDNDIRRLPTP